MKNKIPLPLYKGQNREDLLSRIKEIKESDEFIKADKLKQTEYLLAFHLRNML